MASADEVEEILDGLRQRLDDLDVQYRAMLPSRRVIEADFPDLGITYHAAWDSGRLSKLRHGPADSPDIRIECDSDDLRAMVNGDLRFPKAYAADRLRIDASMVDLLRLHSAL